MYDFQTLSPFDFEELARDLVQAELGIMLESFGPGSDGGIDFRCSRAANDIVIQAKHYVRSGPRALLTSLKSENKKVAVFPETISRYLLITSVSLSPTLKDRIVEVLDHAPLEQGDVIGQEDLNNLLRRHPEVEQKHFKLWLSSSAILERIIRSGVYNRTQTELSYIQNMVPRFVQNQSVQDASTILDKDGALIIAGEPGVGKTTLARMLVWLHAAQDWRIFVIDDISEAFEVANEGEKRLIFFDDFLGQVRLSSDLIRGMDQRLPPFLERVRTNKNLRFILTTRDYILGQAQLLSERLSSASIDGKKYVLNVGQYTRAVRAKILFNHLYFSDLTDTHRASLLSDNFYLKIIDHKNFNPRLIETLTNVDYTEITDIPITVTVDNILDNPKQLWERPYRNHISVEGKALMNALFFNDENVSISDLQASFTRVAVAFELPISRAEMQPAFRAALKELEGSILSIVSRKVRFSNPGVRDFLEAKTIEDNILPLIVSKIETYDELNQCWTLWQDASRSRKGSENEALWREAAIRMLANESGYALDRLQLIIYIHSEFASDELVDCVRAAITQFNEIGIDGDQVRSVCLALENVGLNILPFDDVDALRTVLTKKTTEMMCSFSTELRLDELNELDDALERYGNDKDAAWDALHSALQNKAFNMAEELSDISSVSDLRDFESELRSLMARISYTNHTVDHLIESRKDYLSELEDRDQRPKYNGRLSPDFVQEVTNEEIHSMFSELKNRGN